MEVRLQGLRARPASLPWALRSAHTHPVTSRRPTVPSTPTERDISSGDSAHRRKVILDYPGGPDEITRILKRGRGRQNIGQCDAMWEGSNPPLLALERKAKGQKPRNAVASRSWPRRGSGSPLKASRKERSPANGVIRACGDPRQTSSPRHCELINACCFKLPIGGHG